MMLRHLKMDEHAQNIERSVLKTIADGKVKISSRLNLKFRTGDLGGKATNTQFTNAVIDNLKN